MRLRITACLLATALAGSALAETPPPRPLAITASQFEALREVENQPQHTAIRQVHATYQSERERHLETQRTVDDATSAAAFLGWIGALATILICAAPL